MSCDNYFYCAMCHNLHKNKINLRKLWPLKIKRSISQKNKPPNVT